MSHCKNPCRITIRVSDHSRKHLLMELSAAPPLPILVEGVKYGVLLSDYPNIGQIDLDDKNLYNWKDDIYDETGPWLIAWHRHTWAFWGAFICLPMNGILEIKQSIMCCNMISFFNGFSCLVPAQGASTLSFQEAVCMHGIKFLEEIGNSCVNDNYIKFKNFINTVIKKYVPTRAMRSPKHNVPWINQKIRRMCRKKQHLFNKAKRSSKSRDWSAYKSFKKDTSKALRRAHWQYVNNILLEGLQSKDSKPFWRYVKSKRQDTIGVAPLKSGGNLHSDSRSKATILNEQFTSVFTPPQDKHSDIPYPYGPAYPPIKPLTISIDGVQKLLLNLNVKKASGPDNISCRILRELSMELAPVLAAIYTQSIESGEVPIDWTQALVTPIFKKGNRHLPENYRPVSLTSIPCKIMEHIICSHVRDHLDEYDILSPLQHGFRERHSCKSQLLLTLQDLFSWRDRGVQVDLVVLDFAKAFDTVPHESVLGKLKFYGIDEDINRWVRAFLTNRTQEVVVDGGKSDRAAVASGVPQGTVLGPLLFLLHINDLPLNVESSVRLFADDCLLYRAISSREEAEVLQGDLHSLYAWGQRWGMSFNVKKCNIMRITKSRTPITKFYTLGGQILDQVNQAPYLGVLISEELEWAQHINSITSKANSTLGFIRRNLKQCPKDLKELAYMSLVRSKLEYAGGTWDPHHEYNINKLERVQRCAARFVCHDFGPRSSVTQMLSDLGWQQLKDRRKHIRLALLFKIIHDIILVPHQDLLLKADSRTRSSHQFKYRTIRTSTDPYKHSFFPRTIPEWNLLHSDTVNSETIDQFKSRLLPPPSSSLRPSAASLELAANVQLAPYCE